MADQALELHRESIFIDGTCPLAGYQDYWRLWVKGGATVICLTANRPAELLRETIGRLAGWYRWLREHPQELLLVRGVDDIQTAREQNKLGVILHFQDSTPLENDPDNVEVFHRLGVRILQLAYNVRNFAADGSTERTDSGLSRFGLRAIAEMNRLGITVDCSHTGYRSTMEAIEASTKPVIVSHANARAVCHNRRNLSDDAIRAVAGNGGVVGLNGYPGFVAKKPKPHLDDLLDHADYIINLVGVDHLSVGIDYYQGQAGVSDDRVAAELYRARIEDGSWDPESYPPPPWHYPEGIEMPDKLPNLTAGLLKRGYSPDQVKKILGLNLLRVFEDAWAENHPPPRGSDPE